MRLKGIDKSGIKRIAQSSKDYLKEAKYYYTMVKKIRDISENIEMSLYNLMSTSENMQGVYEEMVNQNQLGWAEEEEVREFYGEMEEDSKYLKDSIEKIITYVEQLKQFV